MAEVSTSDSDVADVLQRDVADLPTGYQYDIDAADALVNDEVVPYATNQDRIDATAVYLAAAFISYGGGGAKVELPKSSERMETYRRSFSEGLVSGEAADLYERALLMDPSDRLGRTFIDFEAVG